MPRSTNKICSAITSAAQQWLDDIGDARSLVSVEQGLGSGTNWGGRDMTTVALKATYISLHLVRTCHQRSH
eukprot:8187469-Karenia_brevis.AAC.1